MADPLMTIASISFLLGWFALITAASLSLQRYQKRKLLRCPETGGITLVDIEPIFGAAATRRIPRWPRVRVTDCMLWPKRISCPMGCVRTPATEEKLAA